MFELTAALPYRLHHITTRREALDMGTEVIAREIAWRRDCLANQKDMSELAREYCERDVQILEYAAAELEAKYNR